MYKKAYFYAFLCSGLSLMSTMVFAKEINLYEQPNAQAKVVGTVDLAKGIIPIFTPQKSEWTKIADPHNGNVGWVKSSDLNNNEPSTTSFTFTQKYINEGSDKTPLSYQVIFSPQNLTPQQTQDLAKKLQAQQQAIQQSMQKTFQDMMNNMNQFYQGNWNKLNTYPFPMILPVIVIPQQKNSITKPTVLNPVSKPATNKIGNINNKEGVAK